MTQNYLKTDQGFSLFKPLIKFFKHTGRDLASLSDVLKGQVTFSLRCVFEEGEGGKVRGKVKGRKLKTARGRGVCVCRAREKLKHAE